MIRRQAVLYGTQRRVSAIQQKLDAGRGVLYSEAIDVTTYGRRRDKLREELTLAKIDHHAEAVEELDVEGILAFAERILPRASDPWAQARSISGLGLREVHAGANAAR